MISLEVTCASKDVDGDIMSIGNAANSWGHSRQEAVRNIKLRTHRYYVRQPDGRQVDIHVYKDKFLRTDPDKYTVNNLDNMGTCPIQGKTILGGYHNA